MEGGLCTSTTPTPARFYNLVAYNCEKGAESVGTGSIQFIDFTLVNNELAGFEIKLLEKNAEYTDDGPLLSGGVVASGVTGLDNQASTTAKAVILPYGRGLLLKDMTYVNFDSYEQAVYGVTKIDGQTEDNNGAFYYEMEAHSFVNSPNKVRWRWTSEGVLVDKDGSMTGVVGGKVVAAAGTNPPSCTTTSDFSVNPEVPGVVCPADVKFHRFSWNEPSPSSLLFRNVTFTNQYGNTTVPFKPKRVTHKMGWTVLLVDGEKTDMGWVDSNQLTNITYYGTVYDFKVRINTFTGM